MSGRELIDDAVIDPARDGLVLRSGFAGDADGTTFGDSTFFSSSNVVSILSLPGCGRCFSFVDATGLRGDTVFGATGCAGSCAIWMGSCWDEDLGVIAFFSCAFPALFEAGVTAFLDNMGSTGSSTCSLLPILSTLEVTLDSNVSGSTGFASSPGGACIGFCISLCSLRSGKDVPGGNKPGGTDGVERRDISSV